MAGVPSVVTVRAKEILKELEKKDMAKGKVYRQDETQKSESEVERILRDTDVNTLSPMQALLLLSDLKEKLNG